MFFCVLIFMQKICAFMHPAWKSFLALTYINIFSRIRTQKGPYGGLLSRQCNDLNWHHSHLKRHLNGLKRHSSDLNRNPSDLKRHSNDLNRHPSVLNWPEKEF